MLPSAITSKVALRFLSMTRPSILKRVKEVTTGDLTTVELENVPQNPSERYFEPKIQAAEKDGVTLEKESSSTCSCVLCQIPVKITYADVLILEQFMRLDGTVLPEQLTGLCQKQQKRLERCVMQAHWSGLFPDRTIAEFDRSGYKRFNRHWDDDLDMFRLKFKMQPGSFYYIKRYNPRAAEYKGARRRMHADAGQAME